MAVITDALLDLDTAASFDQRCWIGDTQIKHLVAMLVCHLQNIRKSGGRYHPDSRTLALDDRVGNQSSAVYDRLHLLDRHLFFNKQVRQTLENSTGRSRRSRQTLMGCNMARGNIQ